MALAPDDWSLLAACRGGEGSLFFSPDTSERKEDRIEREHMAKRICAGCAVTAECLDAAIERRETHGIWGGLNEIERRSLQRR
ncbi:MAG: WhiB family transcriptional regulator [Acidimicrobiaceae bacterium]|jgi:WhiB family redox-sensing transcriptional regulator